MSNRHPNLQEQFSNQKGMARAAISGMFWSLVTNWGSKLSTFVLFIVLARFLTPEEYGIVAAASIVLLFITLIAEFGMGDAIVQRKDLRDEDVNLPFFVGTGLSILFFVIAILFSQTLEQLLKVQGSANVIVWLSGVAPLSTISAYQEAIYRRNLEFKALACRALIGNLVGGPAAIIAAYLGAGIWSLVILNYVTVGAGMIWLWMRPQWKLSVKINRKSFKELITYSMSVLGVRVADFFTLRLIDIIILQKFGIGVLGLYTVGSRLYQVLMQLLQAALSNVSLALLSKISDDTSRMAKLYIRVITLSGLVCAPVFWLTAATSTEICSIMFGDKWEGVDRISTPLLLLGAIQCIQFLNGPYLGARGKPQVVFRIAMLKYALTIAGLLFIPSKTPVVVIGLFSLFQLVATPFTFYAICKDLEISGVKIIRSLFIPAACNLCGFAGVYVFREYGLPFVIPHGIVNETMGSVLSLIYLCAVFGLLFIATVGLIGLSEAKMVIEFVKGSMFKKKLNQGD